MAGGSRQIDASITSTVTALMIVQIPSKSAAVAGRSALRRGSKDDVWYCGAVTIRHSGRPAWRIEFPPPDLRSAVIVNGIVGELTIVKQCQIDAKP